MAEDLEKNRLRYRRDPLYMAGFATFLWLLSQGAILVSRGEIASSCLNWKSEAAMAVLFAALLVLWAMSTGMCLTEYDRRCSSGPK